MMRFSWFAIALFAATLEAGRVDTAVLGAITGPEPLVAGDGQGNILMVTRQSCPVTAACQPFTIVKLDATGKELLRKNVGDGNWRFQINSVALDRSGNIVLAGASAEPNLPLEKPIRSVPAGTSDGYLMQLSPDGTRIQFASYLGGNHDEGILSVAVDAAGNIIASMMTLSTDIPYTGSEIPNPWPEGLSAQAIFRITPGTGQLRYAIGLPRAGIPPAEMSVQSDGAIAVVIPDPSRLGLTLMPRSRILVIAADGTRRNIPLDAPAEMQFTRTAAASDGGYWLAGTVPGGYLPVTPNAWRPGTVDFSYVRWEGSQSITPPGPIRDLSLRLLAVDRADENIILAATTKGIARSPNNGWTWEIVNEAPALRNVKALATSGISFSVIPGAPGNFVSRRLWAIASDAVLDSLYFSDDLGITWQQRPLPQVGTPLPTLIAAHPQERDVLHVAILKMLYTTRDAGVTWAPVRFDGVINGLTADRQAVAVTTSEQAPGTGGRGILTSLHWSDDGGATFGRRANVPLGAGRMQFDPNEPGSLYFTVQNRVTRTNAEVFPEFTTISDEQVPVVQFGFQTGLPGTLFALRADGQGLRSDDGGRTWQPLATSLVPARVDAQLLIGAGGVVHLVSPPMSEAFAGRVSATGAFTYLTYLGIRPSGSVFSLTVTPEGRAVISGQMDGSGPFPGERFRGDPPASPGTLTGPDLFAVAFKPDTRLAYAAALSGVAPDALLWSGAGPGSSFLLLGSTYSTDFPGIPPPGLSFREGAALVLSRLQP